MRKQPRHMLFLLIFPVLMMSTGRAEVIDRIVAVVGDYVILQSEVDFQAQLVLMQQRQKITAEDIENLRSDLLDQMVNDKLLLIRALTDTMIEVSQEEVEAALDQRLDELKSRFPSEAEFERQMAVEGLTYREVKAKFREEVRNQLLKDRLIGRELSQITVAPAEVEDFFEEYKDSLPPHPNAAKLAHILLRVEPSQETLDSARAKAERVKELIDEGRDFAELAREYSEDPSATSGGDLGFFGHGDLVKEFEDAAFALDVGEVSGVVRTEYGFHVIKCTDKQADRIRCSHILFMAKPSDEDMREVKLLADSLKTAAENGADFTNLVKEFSEDEETKKLGGELGWFVQDEMTPEFAAAVEGLEVGEISDPTESQYGVHIIKVLDKQTSRPWNLKEDWDRLKEIARRQKTETVVGKLLEELRGETYVEVRD
jgi:peptidyl-prolyl cis-trans isomerase SurA